MGNSRYEAHERKVTMLTLEQLDRLKITGLSDRAKKDRQYRQIKRMVTDGEWLSLPTWGEPNVIHLGVEGTLQDHKWTRF